MLKMWKYYLINSKRLGLWCQTWLNNISVIPWRSNPLVEEIRVPRENHRPVT